MAGSVEGLQQREQALARDDRVEGDAQLRLPAVGNALHAAFQVAGGAQQVAAVVEQGAPGLVEHGAPADAFEQRDAQLVLQLAHGVRQRGGHAMQRAGGGGEAAVTVDGIEYLQQVEGDFHVN